MKKKFQLGGLSEILAEYRRLIREAIGRGEDPRPIFEKAEEELRRRGWGLAAQMLRQEMLRLLLLRPILGEITPPALPPAPAPPKPAPSEPILPAPRLPELTPVAPAPPPKLPGFPAWYRGEGLPPWSPPTPPEELFPAD